MKKIFTIISLTFIFLVLFTLYDRKQFLVGKSFFMYDMLPYDLTTEWIETSIQPKNLHHYEFYFVYDGWDYFGAGAGCFINETALKNYNLLPEDTFSVCTIKGYYYNDKYLYIICDDSKSLERCVKPIMFEGGMYFIETKTNIQTLRNLTFVSVQGIHKNDF